jgi:uncharacterized protein
MTACYRWTGDTLTLKVRVQPRADRDAILEERGEALRVRLTAPPLDGKANASLIKLIADAFDVPRSQVEIVSGHGSRDKRLRIHSPRALPSGFSPAEAQV